MTRNEHGVVTHRPQPLGDAVDQGVVVPLGEVGATDPLVEQDVATEDDRPIAAREDEDHVAGRVAGDLPDEDLPVYQGENKPVEPLKAGPGNTDDDDGGKAAFAAAVRAYGGMDIVVCNAGIAFSHPIEETPLAAWQRTLDVNITGSFLCARAVLPVMRRASPPPTAWASSTAPRPNPSHPPPPARRRA